MLAYDIRKPPDWQQFERSTCVLVRCVLGDPNAQPNGRQGQAQAGVDIYGTRVSNNASVGVQCKKRIDAPVTGEELKGELAKALTFNPPLDEFILATTAPRDAAIQQEARLLTQAASGTSRPIKVAVWGWQDIEEHAWAHVEAQKAFDSTFSPYVANMHKDLADRIDALRVALAASYSLRGRRLLGVLIFAGLAACLNWVNGKEKDTAARKEPEVVTASSPNESKKNSTLKSKYGGQTDFGNAGREPSKGAEVDNTGKTKTLQSPIIELRDGRAQVSFSVNYHIEPADAPLAVIKVGEPSRVTELLNAKVNGIVFAALEPLSLAEVRAQRAELEGGIKERLHTEFKMGITIDSFSFGAMQAR